MHDEVCFKRKLKNWIHELMIKHSLVYRIHVYFKRKVIKMPDNVFTDMNSIIVYII